MSDDSAYGRVTNPERFAMLHQAAQELVADLRRRFDIVVEPIAPEVDSLRPEVISAVRVTPRNDGAAVTIGFTDFPGLFVRFGSQHTEPFPNCGCDACDEQPAQVANNLREKLESVAHGGFSEPTGGYEFVFPDGGSSSGQADRHFWQRSRTRRYAPWPPIGSG